MAYLLDIAGSFLISFYVIFILIQFNSQVKASSDELLFYNISQLNAATSCEILEHDIYKAGYRVSASDKILLADSVQLKYYGDIDNNGTRDSVHYYIGSIGEMFITFNPADRPLYRKVNGGSPEMVSIVTNFRISYIDSSGIDKIPYADLNTPSKRRKIKGIQVYATVESGEPINGIFQSSELIRTIFPKNIK